MRDGHVVLLRAFAFGAFPLLLVAACSGSDASPGLRTEGTDAGSEASSVDTGTTTNDATTETSTDAGSDASTIDAPEVPLQYGSCEEFVPCGGDPAGTWRYAAGGCVDELTTGFCPGITVDAAQSSIKVRGILTIGAGTLDRNTEATITAKVKLPAECTNVPPANGNCALIQVGLTLDPPNGPGFDSAVCTAAAGGGCDCTATKTVTEKSQTTFVVNGTAIETADGKSYPFCVGDAGGKSELEYQDSVGGLLDATFVTTK